MPSAPAPTIRRLTADDLRAFRTLRRQALLDTPQAFGASPADEDALSDAQVQSRLTSGPAKGVLGAWDGEHLVGLVALSPESMTKLSHKAMLYGMYVAPSHRSQGLGRALLSAALDLAQDAPAIRKVCLYVNLSQQAAVNLYLSLGFVPFGHERDAICVDGRYYDEWLMAWDKPKAHAPEQPVTRSQQAARAEVQISTDPRWLDIPQIHRFLSEQSSWARGIPYQVLERAIENSLCFGVYLTAAADAGQASAPLSSQPPEPRQQIGFARVTTDRATFAYLADVFVLPEYRGQGHSLALMQAIDRHPDLQGLRRFVLATSDAHGLYAKFGFTAPSRPHTLMERYRPDIYRAVSSP